MLERVPKNISLLVEETKPSLLNIQLVVGSNGKAYTLPTGILSSDSQLTINKIMVMPANLEIEL